MQEVHVYKEIFRNKRTKFKSSVAPQRLSRCSCLLYLVTPFHQIFLLYTHTLQYIIFFALYNLICSHSNNDALFLHLSLCMKGPLSLCDVCLVHITVIISHENDSTYERVHTHSGKKNASRRNKRLTHPKLSCYSMFPQII